MTPDDLDPFNLMFAVVIVCAAFALAIAAAVDWIRASPARKLDRLVRRSKGRW